MKQVTLDEAVSLAGSGAALFIEALPPRYFESGHLPGALNVPHDALDSALNTLLASNGGTGTQLIVTYCTGPTCPNSKALAIRLTEMGAANVAVFMGGKEEWTRAGHALVQGEGAAE